MVFVLYEEMEAHPHVAVLEIADFLGPEYAKRLKANRNEILNKVVEKNSLDATTERLNGDFLDQLPEAKFTTGNTRRFARKGIVGDW